MHPDVGSKRPVVLRAAHLVDGSGAALLERPSVVIEDGRITDVHAGGSPPEPQGVQVVNLGDATLLPGLIDCHVHLIGDQVIPPHAWAERPTREMAQKAAEHARQYLRAGVTTIRDCGAPGRIVLDLRDAVTAGETPGPHILAAGLVVTSPAGHGHFMGIEARGSHALRAAVDQIIASGADFIKLIASGGGGTPGTYPWDSQFSLEEIRAVVEAAHHAGVRVGAHAHASAAIQLCVEAGVDTIEHLTFITADGPRLDDGLLLRLAASEVFAIPTISCYRNPVEAGLAKTFIEKIGMKGPAFIALHQGHVRRMLERGVKLAAGTDGIQVGVGPDAVRDEARYLGEVAGSPLFGIRAATGLAAEALGLAHDRGVLAAGMRADILAVRGNPLEDLHALREPLMVMLDGRIVE